MKKGIIALSTIIIMAFAIACSHNDSPKDVAEKFLNATGQLKFEEAKKYCTKETGTMLNMMAGLSAMAPDSVKNKKPDYTMLDEKISGDAAVVTYKIGKSDKPETLNLKKENDKWLVAISKDDKKKENSDAPGDMDNGAKPEDSTATDSASAN